MSDKPHTVILAEAVAKAHEVVDEANQRYLEAQAEVRQATEALNKAETAAESARNELIAWLT